MMDTRRLARNTVLNFVGQAVPLILGLIAIPPLIHGLGSTRFGIFTLVWTAVGYFSLFDLGLGRALTQLIAMRLGTEETGELPALVWTALALMFLLGCAGALAVAAASPWAVRSLLNIPPTLWRDSTLAFYLLAASLPLVLTAIGLRGVLEAHQHFGPLTALRIPLAVLSQLAPVVVLLFSRNLVPVVGALVLSRVVGWFAHLVVCLRLYPSLRRGMTFQPRLVAPLFRIGGWMTVTNVVGPVMVYLDRFLVGVLLPMAAVAYYVTPYELVTKLWLIPSALLGVLFPAFAASYVRDHTRTRALFGRGLRALALALFPPTLLLVAFAHEGLALWVGDAFAGQSAHILQWLAVGVLANGIAQVPFWMLQAIGRADLTAKVNLAELPAYVALLWWMAQAFGLEGVAVGWAVRVSIDAALLFFLAVRRAPFVRPALVEAAPLLALLLPIALVAPTYDVALKAGVVLALLGLCAVLAWQYVLQPVERDAIHQCLRGRLAAPAAPAARHDT